MERNLCLEAGCNALCCNNIYIAGLWEQIKKYFEGCNFKEINPNEEFPNIAEDTTVYYIRCGEFCLAFTNRCPKLSGDVFGQRKCIDYDNRFEVCKIFKRGGEDCNRRRRENGLPRVPIAFVEK